MKAKGVPALEVGTLPNGRRDSMLRGVIRALLVDDVPDLRVLIRLALQNDGRFEVVGEAGDGEEGIRMATELQPDAVLLDLAMPRMDGLTAIPGIRQACSATRILAYSGFQTDSLALKVIDTCGDAYLEKGAAPERIADVFYQVATSPPKTLGVVRGWS